MARYKSRRLLRRPRLTMQQAATRVLTIEPAGREVDVLVPIIDPRSLGRIRGGFEGKSREQVLADIHRPTHALGPVEAAFIQDAYLLGDAVYTPKFFHSLYQQSPRLGFWRRSADRVGDVELAGLASTYVGARWFGHLIWDEFPLQLEVERHAPPVMHARPIYPHESGFRETIGVAMPRPYDALRARELLMLHDRFQSANKTRHYQTMRTRTRASLGMGSDTSKRVFLIRGTSGTRRLLVNEAEVAHRLVERHGFRAIEPAKMPSRDVLLACAGADVIVGVEGSQLSPALLAAADEAILLGINPPDRVNPILAELAPYCGLRGAMVVAVPASGAADEEDFRIEPDDVVAAIDLATARRAAEPGRAADFCARVISA